MRLEYQDDIDRYLLGRMSDEERALFEAKCAENTELKEQLEHTQDVKAVISERGKLLKRIQKWDEDYNEEKKAVARKKRAAIYWSSGIAAAFVAGYFLLPVVNNSESESMGNVISMNTENNEVSPIGNHSDSIKICNEHEKLLAKNETKEKNKEKNTDNLRDDQVLSFDKEFVSSQETKEDLEKELVRVDGEIKVVTEKQSQLTKKLKSGEINKSVYDSRMYMLKFQMDELYWQKSHTLIKLDRISEAIALLNKIRNEDGIVQSKADSLYNVIK